MTQSSSAYYLIKVGYSQLAFGTMRGSLKLSLLLEFTTHKP